MNLTMTWQSEYLQMKGKLLTERQKELLEKGPNSLSSSWCLMAMKYDYEKIMGYKNKTV